MSFVKRSSLSRRSMYVIALFHRSYDPAPPPLPPPPLPGPPSEPSKPVVSKLTSTSVKLKWNVPDCDGSEPVLSYQVEMLQRGFDQWQPIVQQPRTYFVVKTLEPSTAYQFRVSAVNKYGFSPPSEPSEQVLTKGRGLINTSPSFKEKTASPTVKGEWWGVKGRWVCPFGC